MKIKFLGSGSAFVEASENFQSNILITKEVYNKTKNIYKEGGEPETTGPCPVKTKFSTKYMLIDAGTTIGEALKLQGITVDKLDTIFITHLHSDHTGGLEMIGFKRYFKTFPFGSSKPRIVSNTEIMENLWNNTLRGGMESIQGRTCNIDTYFESEKVAPNGSFMFYGTKFELIQTVHVVDNRRIQPSYGLMFNENGKCIFISGDAQSNPNQMMYFYEKANFIFHDCEFENYPQSVHAQFHELCELPVKIKSKMWLYHYMLNDKSFEELAKEVIQNGFAGLVRRGQEFNTKFSDLITPMV
jgi:ribonuclease BN (tRNA processing enzyme)